MAGVDVTAPPLRAGFVRRAHGVGGEARVEVLGGDPGRFVQGLRLVRESTGEIITVRTSRAVGDAEVLLTFDELPTREDVAGLGNDYLCVERDAARPLGDSEWFVADLIGLRAIDEQGRDVGIISDIETTAAHDVVVVTADSGVRRFPMVRAFVRDVDVDAGTMTLAPWDEI